MWATEVVRSQDRTAWEDKKRAPPPLRVLRLLSAAHSRIQEHLDDLNHSTQIALDCVNASIAGSMELRRDWEAYGHRLESFETMLQSRKAQIESLLHYMPLPAIEELYRSVRGSVEIQDCKEGCCKRGIHQWCNELHRRGHGGSPMKNTSDRTSILEATRQLEGQAIDMLINNAGIGIPSNFETRTKDVLINQFEVNAAGLSVVTPFIENQRRRLRCAALVKPRKYWQLHNCDHGLLQAGRLHLCVKAALIMVTRSLAFDLQPSGIVIVLVHPGYMDTDVTQGKTTLKPEDSVMVMASIAKP
ncbi:C-factor [Phytophthora nicotianae]|uniref:C-factor n=1 Tax=Phytophthora nicotianae TaxID=4792 RepID=A0A0W8C248_PHYNI|nr:C-factor [Phytophthora nicotianae]